MKAAPDQDQPAPSRPPWAAQYPRDVDWLLDIPVRPVHALLDDAVAAFAARPFLDFFGRRQTYAQAARLIAKAALGFQRLGVRKGTKVGLLLPNSPYSVISYFAILKAGGTVVNYDPLCAEQALIRQIEDSETDIMVTLDLTALYRKGAAARAKTNLRRIVICNMAQAFPFFSGLMLRLAHWWEIAKPSRGAGDVLFDELIDNDGTYEGAEIAPLSDVAVIQYTGGTTGEPKGVMLSHQNIYANTCQNRAWFTGNHSILPFLRYDRGHELCDFLGRRVGDLSALRSQGDAAGDHAQARDDPDRCSHPFSRDQPMPRNQALRLIVTQDLHFRW